LGGEPQTLRRPPPGPRSLGSTGRPHRHGHVPVRYSNETSQYRMM
jgi:hypothetical protein